MEVRIYCRTKSNEMLKFRIVAAFILLVSACCSSPAQAQNPARVKQNRINTNQLTIPHFIRAQKPGFLRQYLLKTINLGKTRFLSSQHQGQRNQLRNHNFRRVLCTGARNRVFYAILVKNHKSRKKPGFLVRSIKAKETGFLRVLWCGNEVFREKPGF